MILSPPAHQLVRFCRVVSIEESRHLRTKILEVNGFCDITVKASGSAFFDDLSHNIGRECNDRHQGILVGSFPCADVTAGLIAIFSWHMKITLSQILESCETACDETYKNQ
jgi:hypothetical protein